MDKKETRAFRNLLTGEVFTAYQTTHHSASSYGQPVWVNAETKEAFDLFGMEEVDDGEGEDNE